MHPEAAGRAMSHAWSEYNVANCLDRRRLGCVHEVRFLDVLLSPIVKGCDAAYLTNIHSEFSTHPDYVKGDDRRNWNKEFGIRHYAGTVTYAVKGFVDKNRDTQQDVFFDYLEKSDNALVQELCEFKVSVLPA